MASPQGSFFYEKNIYLFIHVDVVTSVYDIQFSSELYEKGRQARGNSTLVHILDNVIDTLNYYKGNFFFKSSSNSLQRRQDICNKLILQ
jgi:hypothetical protein